MKQKFAIPLENGLLCSHFGHCQQFAIVTVEDNTIVSEELVTPPPHEPGILPEWLSARGVTNIIAGGIGNKAVNLFKAKNIDIIVGAELKKSTELVTDWLNNTLMAGENCCDH